MTCDGCRDEKSDDLTYVVSSLPNSRTKLIRSYFHGEVNDDSVTKLIESFTYWDAEYPDSNWELTINSGGGYMYAGNAAYSDLRRHSLGGGGTHHVTTRVAGIAASGGELLFQAGDRRVGGALDMIMIHGPLASYEDSTVAEIRVDLARCDKWMSRVASLHLARTDMVTRTEFMEHLQSGEDWWLYLDEAVELGLADKVLP